MLLHPRDHQSIFSTLLKLNLVLTLIFKLDHAINASALISACCCHTCNDAHV